MFGDWEKGTRFRVRNINQPPPQKKKKKKKKKVGDWEKETRLKMGKRGQGLE